MPRHQLVETHGLFAQALYDRLAVTKMSLNELAEKCDSTYEHMRKLRVGGALPSPLMLKAVCQATGLKLHEMQRLVTADSVKAQYGSIPEELAGKDPSLAKMERLWKQLDPADRKALEAQAEALVNERRRQKQEEKERTEPNPMSSSVSIAGL